MTCQVLPTESKWMNFSLSDPSVRLIHKGNWSLDLSSSCHSWSCRLRSGSQPVLPSLTPSSSIKKETCISKYCGGRPSNKPGYLNTLKSLWQRQVNLVTLCLKPSLKWVVVALLYRKVELGSILVENPPVESNPVIGNE